MPKQNKKRNKRVKNLIVIFSLTAVILSVSTYAWFIGMRTVNVSSFDVEVAGTDSLLLSLDGSTWKTTIDLTKENLGSQSYDGNTNNWAGRGLFPVSSIGEMDTKASRMKLFEKASLTASAGGYRLLASRVNNYQENNPEQDGYVVFDLFVRNYSGTQYLEKLEPNDEEAIYLNTDSTVSVASTGVADTGIENSVRVAFAQIGRVAGTTTDVSKITGITCNADAETGNPTIVGGVTGICGTAAIWEPNDTKHVSNAISWYTTSCKTRTGETPENVVYGSGTCGSVINGTSYPTYAIKTAITSANKVDIYDGEAYNTYAGSETSNFLYSYDYFTDSEKIETGTNRDQFMTLEPNSITKIRVYIYIEGQDIDNYDFASIGKTIAVKFGFTKERFTTDDIHYTTPSLPTKDATAPVITLTGDSTVHVIQNTTYNDLGATANDTEDGVITDKIQTINPVDTSVVGTYTVTYNVSDWSGNYAAQVTRTVIVDPQS